MDVATGDLRRLDLNGIVEAAKAETGLVDMGEPDILPGLQVLIDALVQEANLRPAGVEAQRAALVRIIANRLRIEDTIRRHPDILDEQICGPIVILGLPRSGTTKFQRMMAASPALQKLPLWKMLNPASIGPIVPGAEDPRIAIAEQVSAAMREYFPDFYAGHPMEAHEPDEEEFMLDLVMRGYLNCHLFRIPSFEAWMDRQSFDSWYPYLRKVLQLLQWQDGSPQTPWLLKTNSHLRHLPLLFKSFPDATIVHCHRDPVTAIASFAKVTEASRRMYSDDVNIKEVGRFTLDHWATQMDGYLAQRLALENRHRFVDVSYAEITGNVMAAIERVYAAAAIPLTATARAAMLDWEARNPPGKHGAHRYSLQDSGLSETEIRRAFSGYLARFGKLH